MPESWSKKCKWGVGIEIESTVRFQKIFQNGRPIVSVTSIRCAIDDSIKDETSTLILRFFRNNWLNKAKVSNCEGSSINKLNDNQIDTLFGATDNIYLSEDELKAIENFREQVYKMRNPEEQPLVGR